LSARQPTLEDVQKQYRRLALAVHPDKCSHVLPARYCTAGPA
jgi:curved DNA-binding protein CbpA